MQDKAKSPPSFDSEVSVAKALFLGQIEEGNLFPFPKISGPEAETISLVLESMQKFLAGYEGKYREFDKDGAQPEQYVQQLKELGLFGLIVPEAYGGVGFSNLSYSRVIQESSRFDASTSLTIGAHSSIGMKGLLLFGNDQQKQKYLPKLATGEMIAAFCLTEPGSGSDAGSITTHAKKNSDGSWTLNGSKIWITNGSFANFFTVFARTEGEKGKLTAFLVERAFPGVSTGAKEDKMGIRASSTTAVDFQNVIIPAENVLGEEGKGFKVAMSILNSGRTGLGGGCVGGMKAALQRSILYSKERKQFGNPISDFRLIKGKLAQMAVDCFAAESVVSMVGHYLDSGSNDYSVEAAISKIFATEALWQVANESLQIAGGTGFMKEYPYERLVRDARINMIFEGTNEILRLYVGLSGLKGAGSYLSDLSKSVGNIFNDPIKGFGIMTDYATKKVTHLTSLGRDRLSFVAAPLHREAGVFEDYTVGFARQCEKLLRMFGKDIIGNQFDTARIADTAKDLFVGLSVLSRVSQLIQEKSEAECEQEIILARIFTQQAKRRMNQNLRRIDRNEDEDIVTLADWLLDKEKYPWDVF
ncbi:MAG: acyl-CoA dehydrogenase family protein [Bdellovibrionales bacterium]|nr:acyl-CoA dehydrogenase family protein [Bdellovibrionales bacterium]